MTIRRRLILSFAVILALFAINLVVYFWSSSKRTDSVDMLQRAVNRQLKIQSIQQKISEVKSQVAILNQITPEVGVGGVSPEVAGGLNQKLTSIADDAASIERALSETERRLQPNFGVQCRALVGAWTTFIANVGRDQTKAITALSGQDGAETLTDELLTKELPHMAEVEARRVSEARKHIDTVISVTDTTTVLLFLISIILSFAVAVLLSSYLSRGLFALQRGVTAIGAGDLTQKVEVLSHDELGAVATAFNEMTDSLHTAQLEVAHRSAELEARDEELQLMNDQLVDSERSALSANQAKSDFLAKMSHELRTPLNAIIGYSEMLQEEAEDIGQDSFVPDLKKIRAAGRHLLALINDILDLSKIEAGRMEVYLEEFEIEPMVHDVISTINPLVEKSGNRLEIACAADLGTMRSDLTKVRQVLFNLLSNACKFTSNGTVKLNVLATTENGHETLQFAVADTGIGMSNEQIGKLFQDFVQADASTTRKYGGTGLGLAISKRFCEMLGGGVTVTSEVGKGSVFTMVLPRVTENTAPKSPEEEPTNAEQTLHKQAVVSTVTPADAAGVPNVLVIDDDPDVRDIVSRYLTQDGFSVQTAQGGAEGLQLARERLPDLITLDVMMPAMDGWAVLSALKSDPITASIPVVMLTILEQKEIGLALGAADYLTKPIEKASLSAVASRFGRDNTVHPVLVIEDDENTRDLFRRTLEKDGWRVNEAANGRIALDKLGEGKPDLILLDLMMAEMDGFELVAQLKQQPEWRSIPVVVVTAKSLSSKERERLSGVMKVLQKGSYTREDLLTEVRTLVKGYLSESQVENSQPAKVSN